MHGEAKVTYQKMEIDADYIEMSMDHKEILATGRKDSSGQLVGNPVYKDGDQTYECKELRYNFNTRKAFVKDVVMKQEPEGIMHSHITKRDSSGILSIRDGKYTTCDAPEPHFYFNITKGMMVKNKVVTKALYLVVEGIPLYPIGLPFGFLPKQEKRTSGILIPKYGEEQKRGFFLREGGYYFAFSDHLDLALTGGIYSRGSYALGARSNYKKIYKYSGNFALNIAHNTLGEKGLPDYSKQKDFSVLWSHTQDSKANPYNEFNASVNFSSSAYDKLNTYSDYSNPMEHLTNQKSSSITYRRKFTNKLFNFTAKVGHSQNSLDRSVALTAPSGSFTVGRFYPFRFASGGGRQKWYELIEMRYTSSFENKVKAREDSIFTSDVFKKMSNGFKHEIPLSASFKPIQNMTLTPSLNYQGTLYFSQIEKIWDPSLDSILINKINRLSYIQSLTPNINLTYSPRFYGTYDFSWGKVKTIRHMMTPSISFSYRPDLGYDLGKYQRTLVTMDESSDGKITEYERSYSIFDEGIYDLPSVAGKSGIISFSLGNNLEMKVKNPSDSTGQLKKVKLLESFNLTTTYDVFKDSLNLSDFNLTARTTILEKFSLQFRSAFDPYAIDSINTSSGASYRTINTFEVSRSGKLARMTGADLTFGFSLPLDKKKQGGDQGPKKAEQRDYQQGDPVDFESEWNLRVDYNFRYSKPYYASTITQSLRFSGDLALTKKWKISMSSGYDFVNKEFTYTTLGIHRDLHCWQMNIDIVPFGERKSYTFTLNAVASMLKDVKYRKAKDWRDQ